MDSNTVVEVVRRLVGPVHAIGEHGADTRSLENLDVLAEAVEELLTIIVREYEMDRGHHEASIVAIERRCKRAIDSMSELLAIE